MRAVIFTLGSLALSACGTTVEEDISSRSDYSPLGEVFFVPVTDETRAALAASAEWSDFVDNYQ